MMGVPEVEVDEILENEKRDLRIAGFEEEDKRYRRRMLGGPGGQIKLPQGAYIFADFCTLQIPGVEVILGDSNHQFLRSFGTEL